TLEQDERTTQLAVRQNYCRSSSYVEVPLLDSLLCMRTTLSSRSNVNGSDYNETYSDVNGVCFTFNDFESEMSVGGMVEDFVDRPTIPVANLLRSSSENFIWLFDSGRGTGTFVHDNSCTIEFDPLGFLVKDFITRRVRLRCDSTGDLYPVTKPSTIPHAFLTSQYTWHQRLGLLGSEVLRRLVSSDSISCNKEKLPVLCHACQHGKHVKLSFCDHGGEFDNHAFHKLLHDNGIQFRFSYPRTSQQNGKSKRMIRTINNLIRNLLFQAHLPPDYWTEALDLAVCLFNKLPSLAINNEMPFTFLFGAQPDYSVLHVFGCLCYPHIDTNHKFGPRATPSIILRHAANHFGYRCLDLNTNKIIISCHVTFDEMVFLFPSTKLTTTPSYYFLDDSTDLIFIIIRTAPITPVPTPVHTLQVNVPTPPTPPPPHTPRSVPQIYFDYH
nr:ribonuclease H-like domain-containing protein [Tanacetum cinerariifolium]